jgi:lysophospholipase L1-like esterase
MAAAVMWRPANAPPGAACKVLAAAIFALAGCGEGRLDAAPWPPAAASGGASGDAEVPSGQGGATTADAEVPAEPGDAGDDADAHAVDPPDADISPPPGKADAAPPANTLDAAPLPPAEPDAAPPPPPPPPPGGPLVYPADRDHSPVDDALAAQFRGMAEATARTENVFSKIGDSITVGTGFLHCFAGDAVRLDGRAALQATIDHFRAGNAGGSTPFDRTSLAATVGWSVQSALRGAPSPVSREIDAVSPRFAVVMFGTNDIENDNPSYYGDQMRTLVDLLLDRGVIPLLSTIPPRDDRASSDAEVPTYNTLVRALAQSRGVPLMDLHRRLRPIPGHGLAGDNLHLDSAGAGSCDFRPDGLTGGNNVRNLLTLEALDRVRRVLAGEPPPDAGGPYRTGAGTAADPVLIEALPFGDVRNTHAAPQSALPEYPGCQSQADEGGGEFVYRLDLAAPARIRADVADGDGVDVDLHLLVDPTDAGTCLHRHDRQIVADLGAGTWYFVLDTYVAAGAPQPGEYLLAIVAE